MTAPPLLAAAGLSFTYPGGDRPAVRNVDLELRRGELLAVIGPNGSGKSTLVKLLLGTLDAEAGEVRHDGRPLEDWGRRALARRVGVVPQQERVTFPVTVREFVAMGRYPHLGAWRSERAEDRHAVRRAMDRCDVADLASRPFSHLSGGEQQLARLARALAQQPEVLVLDEPTVSLDVRHEMEIFELLRDLAGGEALTVLLVTHNLNAAARYADRLVLLDEGRPAAEGSPADVLTRETVERVYRWPVRVTPLPGPGPDAGAPQVIPLARGAERGGRGPGATG